MHPMSVQNDAHEDQPWYRLHRSGKVVGYAREVGQGTYYSKDGYGWSASEIKHDTRLPQLKQALYRHRVYHGDLVKMPAQAGAQAYTTMAVLVDGEHVWLWNAESEHLTPLLQAWPPPSTPRVHEVVGSMYANPRDAARIDASFQWLIGPGQPTRADWFGLGLTMALGLAVIVGVQAMLMGTIGPVTSSFGVLCASLLYFIYRRRRNWYVLRRDWMLRLAVRVAGCLGVWSAALCAFWVTVTPPSVDAHPVFLMGVMAVLGALVGGIATVIGADLVAWRTGGYAGEDEAMTHFRELG